MQEVRLIDANALLESLKESANGCLEWKEEAKDEEVKIRADQSRGTFIECALRVKNAPTIEPEVRHGRWIPTEYDSYADGVPVWDKFECSECGHEHSGEEDTLTAFCPDCGARMDAAARTA